MASALPELMNWPILAIVSVSESAILKMASAIAEPSRPNTIDTVVEVGSPSELKMSSRITLPSIIPRNRNIISWNVNISGWNTPLRATSIIPLEVITPIRIPTDATSRILR